MNEPIQTSHLRCVLCGTDEFDVVFKAGASQPAQIVQCRGCNLMYSNPRARPPDVDLFSVGEGDPAAEADLLDAPITQMRIKKEELQTRDYRTTHREINRIFPNRGRLLEIGSGFGYSLDVWKRFGWDVVGIDPWHVAAAYCKRQFDIPVHTDVLGELGFEDDAFDVVVMFHVIEHLPDPLQELREIFRVMKPGGRFVCETPRYDTLMFKLLGRRERSMACPGHIYFFTIESLVALAKKAGFVVDRVRVVGRSMSLRRLIYNLGIVSKSSWLTDWASNAASDSVVNRVPIYINARDMQRITFRKPEANKPDV
ncbi:MAG: methyltransferase domain-containing protein [Phycisphaera sp.]|nr:methyltransferase domain-containing protein [Phycisphaera sp.]